MVQRQKRTKPYCSSTELFMLLRGPHRWLLLVWVAAAAATAAGSAPAPTPRARLRHCNPPYLDAAVQHLSEIVQFATVSNAAAEHHAVNSEEFRKLGAWLASTYADVWQHFQVEQVGSGSLSHLLTWHGSQPQLRPVLFVSHIDVVPVTAETLQEWRHPPFSGAVADGAVWGNYINSCCAVAVHNSCHGSCPRRICHGKVGKQQTVLL
ncbi:hypothetical protein COO60DRAFT_676903 [Scenedesmus sp. NREL 46B-D3]|nr:hypothetical protein COO60DRAFT_676903 [Scenedesmus sp. NREL 46B-D3]